jgi:hypothetical protein
MLAALADSFPPDTRFGAPGLAVNRFRGRC